MGHKAAAEGSGAAHREPATDLRPETRTPNPSGAIVRLLVFLGMLAILGRVAWLLAHSS
jgi:hypothetical protein